MERYQRALMGLLAVLLVSGSSGAEPVVEPTVEPAVEPVIELAVDPVVEPVVDQQEQEEAVSEVVEPDASGVFPSLVHKGDITEFLKFLSVACHKNIIPSPKVRGPVTINLFDVTFKEALEAILSANNLAYEEKGPFIFVYTKKEYEQMQLEARKMESQVFRLDYIPTNDVQSMIKPLLSKDGKVTTSPQGGSDDAEGWAAGNYLIVLDYPENIDEVGKLIEEIDKRPLQVLVEATIMVASLDDTNELGVDFNALGGINFEASAGVVGSIPSGEVSLTGTDSSLSTGFSTNVTSGGLSIGIVKNNLGIFIKALESTTDTVTLGNPKILTLNRQEGKVIVGNRDGYITTEVSQTTATQTVEFLETGTQLTFRPFVTSDGYIRMELNPKDSDGGVEVAGNFTLPSETTAEVTTNVLVKDGHTIVIGGLFRDRASLTRAQVPLLGNIPFLGELFRSTSDVNGKEEVIFMITPHIVEEAVDYAAAEEVMDNCNQMVLGLREGMQWHGRDRLAAAHYHWAVEHQQAGNMDKALWDASLATYISPGFTDAQYLREELLAREVYRGETGSMRLFMRRLIEGNDESEASNVIE